MKVAIIGAGPAGLSCARELEALGIIPDIYEKKRRPGYSTPLVVALLSAGRGDPLGAMQRSHGLNIAPLGAVRKIIVNKKGGSACDDGAGGWFFERGQGKDSLECQLAAGIKGKIFYNSPMSHRDLSSAYEHIVVADGSIKTAEELNLWQPEGQTRVKMASIPGDFNAVALNIYRELPYAPEAYAYIAPHSNMRASLVLIISNITATEMDKYWNAFMKKGKFNTPTETAEMQFQTGTCQNNSHGKILLAGKSGGFFDEFVSKKPWRSIASGVLAARAIARGESYEQLIKPLLI